MRIIVDIEKDALIEKLSNYVKNIVWFFYRWISEEGEVLGYILGFIHVIGSVTIASMIIVSHTIYPVFWFQVLTFVYLFLVWIQHLFLGVCVVTVAEQSLTKRDSPFHKILKDVLEFYNLNIYQFIKYLFISETVMVACFFLEILSNLSRTWHQT